jgi:hypothetical protein
VHNLLDAAKVKRSISTEHAPISLSDRSKEYCAASQSLSGFQICSSCQAGIVRPLLTQRQDFDLAQIGFGQHVNFAEATSGSLPFVRSTELYRAKEVL